MRVIPIVAELPLDPKKASTAKDIALFYLRALGEMVDGKIHDIICRPSFGDRAEVNAYPDGLSDEIDIDKYQTVLYFPDDNDLDRSWWYTLKLYGQESITLIVTIDDGSE